MKYHSYLAVFVPALFLSVFLGFLPAASIAETTHPKAGVSPAQTASPIAPASASSVTFIPGPLRSFLRMAGISQEVSADEVLPLLARNVALRGFLAGKPTEYLILMRRYIDQAAELSLLADADGTLRVSNCNQAGPVLRAIGYRLKQGCGPDAALETAEPERAFLTVDSGFPLAELEEALRGENPLVYAYSSTQVPVLLKETDWTGFEANGKIAKPDLVDVLLSDLSVARLYWDFSRMDNETRASLRQSLDLKQLIPYVATLDYYGGQISIRSGKVVVPGGDASAAVWSQLVNASPSTPGRFVVNLLAKDNGLLAAYFDALSRVSRVQRAYFVEPHRLPVFYAAFRGEGSTRNLARSIFVPYPGLLLLTTRLQLDPNGNPLIPGGVETWKEIVRRKNNSKIVKAWAGRAARWTDPQQVLEAMFAFSRDVSQEGPLDLYLALSEMDRNKPADRRLSAQTVRLLADKFQRFGDQYLIFSEFSDLDNASITRFLSTAETLDRIRDPLLRADALGILQGDIGLWEILARQGEIPSADWNDSWQHIIGSFANVGSSAQLFDAGRASVGDLLHAATGKSDVSQNELVNLLAGPDPSTVEGRQVRQTIADKMRKVLDDQRLVSFDTIFALGDGLNEKAQALPVPADLIQRAGELREFELPRPLFTNRERTEFSAGLFNNRHAAIELQSDVAKILSSQESSKELLAARGLLAPFLRDTVVGLNYAYYEPPGAEMIHNNSLFVRAQDFSGQMSIGGAQAWQVPQLSGRGWSASGGAHLAGSLAELPYVLAQVEEDFIVPNHVQALIWEDLVPTVLTSATLPRWWDVTANELHAVSLYQRGGEELMEASAKDSGLRPKVMNILSDYMLPQTAEQVEGALSAGRAQDALAETTPGQTSYLAAEFRREFPDDNDHWGPAGKELGDLVRRVPSEVSWERLSQDFGVPHPSLARSYTRELLIVKPFPASSGYSSQLLAESWESNNLYWARLADEMGYPPVMLNRLIPELTYHMVEEISASHFDDWPALLRAMRETGEEFRSGKIAPIQSRESVSVP
jgi:hypothetical protein